MKKHVIYITILLLLISCRKTEKLYNGTIVGVQNGCFLPPAQFPYIIKFDDVTELEVNHPVRIIPGLDSSCMALVPNEYKVIGKKIRFGFRKADVEFTCNGNSLIYFQAVITEISSR